MMLHPMAQSDIGNLKLCGIKPHSQPVVSNDEFQIFIDLAFSKEDRNTSFRYAMFFKGNLVNASAFKGPRIFNFKEAETGPILFPLRRAKSLEISMWLI